MTTTTGAGQTRTTTRTRTRWGELPTAVHDAIASVTGPILGIEPVTAGLNCGIAALLRTPAQTVFLKGLRSDHPRVATQRREADINAYVTPIAPRLLWQLDRGGWNILGFEHLPGRHANLTPGSPDLPKLVDALRRLGRIPTPELPLRRLEHRWAGLISDADLARLCGTHLLHTDLNPHNILITDQARIVDWAWPTLGAAWIDPACAALWLIAKGHTPAAAETWASQIPSWATASRPDIDAFTAASRRLWEHIAHDDPQPWKCRLHAAARTWGDHRGI